MRTITILKALAEAVAITLALAAFVGWGFILTVTVGG